MGSLLVVTGPPGAGKSTVASQLVERLEPSALVEGDTFFGFLRQGAVEPWLPESSAQNHTVTAAAAHATGEFVRGGFATVFDGVVGPWLLDHFVSSSGLDRLDYVVLLPSVDTCVDRVGSRTSHDFADEPATRKMHTEFANAPVDPRHVLGDPPNEVGAVVDLIESLRAEGALEHHRGMT